MKLLITGAYGQLGNEMRVALQRYPQFEPLFTDVDTLDICNLQVIDAFVAANRPDAVVNCAAYTAVDKAEDDEALCRRVNCAESSAKSSIRSRFHISTPIPSVICSAA